MDFRYNLKVGTYKSDRQLCPSGSGPGLEYPWPRPEVGTTK